MIRVVPGVRGRIMLMSDAQQPESTTDAVPPVPPAPVEVAAPASPYAQQPANPYVQQPANPYAQQPANPNPYAPAPGSYAPAPAGPSRLNVLGLVSLILGGFAFLLGVTFGWIPFVGFLPITLALVGLVLGIVGLIVKNKGKGLAIAGTIVSAVALLVSTIITVVMIVAFTTLQSYTDDFDDLDDFGIEEPSITEPDGGDTGDGAGSIEQPAAIGDTITFTDSFGVDEWQVVVGEPTLDATAAVMAADEFNFEPEAGSQYVVVPLVYTYVGTESGFPFLGANPEFVGSDGAIYAVTYAAYPDGLYDAPELTNGAQAPVNAVFEVPSSAVAGGVLTLTSIYGVSIYVAVA